MAARKHPKRETSAVHLTDGEKHFVGVRNLRVLLCEDDGHWFAHGLEIDYAAAGKTLDEVKQHFADGLMLTINEHLRLHGSIKYLLQVAPQEVWQEFFCAPNDSVKLLSTVTAHEFKKRFQRRVPANLPKPEGAFPFDAIQFIRTRKEPVPA